MPMENAARHVVVELWSKAKTGKIWETHCTTNSELILLHTLLLLRQTLYMKKGIFFE